ncbi:MAG: STAS/SEC14 domain-containing protein [Acidimicrobiales bacterium]
MQTCHPVSWGSRPGEVHADDYRTTLIPALDAQDGPLRLVYVLGDRFEGYSGGAAWQDAKLGLDHHGRWHRAAIVTDTDWLRHLAGAFAGWCPARSRCSPRRAGRRHRLGRRRRLKPLPVRPTVRRPAGEARRCVDAVDEVAGVRVH